MNDRSSLEQALPAIALRLGSSDPGIVGLQRLSGGATQEIWRFALGDEVFILRRLRGGDWISHVGVGLEVEAALLTAAEAAGVPVPRVRYVLTPDDGLGHGFIMDFVAGETVGGRIVKSEALASARAVLARQCGEILAAIHRIDPGEFPDLDRLSPADLVGQWRSSYGHTNWPRPVFDLAFRWLAERAPPRSAAPVLVHGDFRNGNLMVGPEGIRAVLDWELAHIGDPYEDLAWLCVNSWRFGASKSPWADLVSVTICMGPMNRWGSAGGSRGGQVVGGVRHAALGYDVYGIDRNVSRYRCDPGTRDDRAAHLGNRNRSASPDG